jgi:hypothetical protein
MKKGIQCWRCGHAVRTDQLPITRLEYCHHCHADLHACRLCRSWNPRYTSKCSNDHAEPPLDRERANFCQYFRPAAGVNRGTGAPAGETTVTDLEALFGANHEQPVNPADNRNMTESERARAALDDLFGAGKDKDTPGST